MKYHLKIGQTIQYGNLLCDRIQGGQFRCEEPQVQRSRELPKHYKDLRRKQFSLSLRILLRSKPWD
jgi:hypothetical protein